MLPTVAPRGCWAQAEQLLANAIAACEETWAFLGVPDEEAARAGNMWIDAATPPLDGEEYGEDEYRHALLPQIIIGTPGDEADAFRLFRRSSPNDFGAIGTLEIQFRRLPEPNQPIPDEERRFKNHVGVILEQATSFGDQNGYLHMQELTVQEYAREAQEGEDVLGELQLAIAQVPWGVPEGGGEE